MIFTREIPVKYKVDVFVAGGGPAGVAAAVACARQGKSVFLAEAQGSFGGLGTVGMVPLFAQFGDGIHMLAGGFGKEVQDAVCEPDCNAQKFFPFPVEPLKRFYDKVVTEAGVQFSFFTNLIAVETNGDGHVEAVILSAKSGIFAIQAGIYLDCTGDGDLSAMAGADFERGNEEGITMPSTLCSLWADIDFSRVKGSQERMLEQAIADGVFSAEDRHLPGIAYTTPAHGVGGGNAGHCYEIDGTDEVSLTKGMLRGRQYLPEYERYYREYLPGFENVYLAYSANVLGVRESRRITGDYQLTVEDFKARANFEDEIGRYAYPVDIHAMKPSKEAYKAFAEEFATLRYHIGESYGIPLRALRPAKLDNVFVAGRCVSTDRQMQASIRVMPGCFITGQAIGIAAALTCEKRDSRAIDIHALQQKLVDFGAYLPNYTK